MDILLKVLGSCFLTIIVLGAIGFLALRFSLKRLAKNMMESVGGMVPPTPSSIRLIGRNVDWNDPNAIEAATSDLLLNGFSKGADFEAEGMPGLHLRSFTKEAENLYAVVYEHSQGLIWCDLWQAYEDGRSLTVTSAPMGAEIDAPEYSVKVYDKGATPSRLYSLYRENRLDSTPRAVSHEAFVEAFETEFRKSMEWRATRGGPTEDEIRRVAALDGVTLSDDELAEMRNQGHREAMWQMDALIRQRFLDSGVVSAARWDDLQFRMCIVHDRMDETDLAEALMNASGHDIDFDDPKWALPAGLPTLEKFDLLVGRLEGPSPLILVWESVDPVPLRVYEIDPAYEPPELEDDEDA